MRRLFVAIFALALAASCATTGGPPTPPSQPIARQALRPEFRIFYDALQDYGDWVLIEPYGYVFRPVVDPAWWRPYQEGFWVPNDVYGWVWVSSEPYGWATYHYGTWFYDDFQGWVWQPGLDWGPAWVTWEQSDDYVGWSPLMPGPSGQYASVPGGPFVYAPIRQLGSTQVRSSLLKAGDLGPAAEALEPVDRTVERDGVAIRPGPSIERIERAVGFALPRTRIEDAPLPGPQASGGRRRDAGKASAPSAPATTPAPDVTRRAGEDAAREARGWVERKAAPPSRVQLARPLPRETGAERRARPARPAPADSSGR